MKSPVPVALALALALALAGLGGGSCADPSPADPVTGTAIVEIAVAPEGLPPDASALFDLSTRTPAPDCDRVGERVLWRHTGPEVVTVALPCVPGADLDRPVLALVGSYTAAPARFGPFGAAPPSATAHFTSVITGPDTLRCPTSEAEAGPPPRFTVHLGDGSRGFIDLMVTADRGGAADIGWRVGVHGDHPADAGWERVVSPRLYGDNNSFSYVGPCGLGPVGSTEDVTVSVALDALYDTLQPVPTAAADDACCGDCDAPLALPHPGRLEAWPLPEVTREVACVINHDTFVQLGPIAVARVAREALGTRAVFNAVSCAADWRCAEGPAPPALSLSCTPNPALWTQEADLPAPAMHLDDLVLRCAGAADLALDPTADAALVTDSVEGRPVVTWRVTPALDPARLAAGPCTLHARATAAIGDAQGPFDGLAADGRIPAGTVYPVVTWAVPVSDATGPVCAPAYLDTTGPVGLGYTSPDATADTVFAHRSDAGVTP